MHVKPCALTNLPHPRWHFLPWLPGETSPPYQRHPCPDCQPPARSTPAVQADWEVQHHISLWWAAHVPVWLLWLCSAYTQTRQ